MLTNRLMGAAAAATNTDPNFKNVSLLLQGDGTNGAQNNTFLDSSTNNFTITRNGNTTQGTFSPYGDLWSNYFDGTGDYLSRAFTSTTDGMYPQGTTYTIEAWIYMTLASSSYQVIFSTLATNTGGFGGVYISISSGVITFGVRPTTGGVEVSTSGGSVAANTWNHVAISVNAGSGKLFVNGTQVGSTITVSACSFTPVGWATGRNANGYMTGGIDFNGYISNMRLVQGVALYTGNFTPSTTPLTAVSGTSLLTCQSNRFIDNSANNFTITRNGDAKVTNFSPFNPTAAYSPSVNGGSGYFDGDSDYLSFASTGSLSTGYNSVTLEAWVYVNALKTNYIYNNGAAYRFGINNTGSVFFAMDNNADGSSPEINMTTTAKVQLSSWNHVAFVRNGTSAVIYINGVSAATATSTSAGNSTLPRTVNIGNYNSTSGTTNAFSGYISDFRFVNGSAVYTTNFAPPTAPLSAITNTVLLCTFTNAGIIDGSTKNDLEAVGNAQVSTSVKKYGTGSLAFDGTGDYLTSNPATTDLYAFGSGDFTIEMWVNFSSFPAGAAFATIYDSRPVSTNGAYVTIYMDSTNLYYYANTANRITVALSTFGTGTWKHLAVCRSGTSTKMFVDGTQVGSTYTDSTVYLNSALRPYIGASSNASPSVTSFLNGYIDDLRITKGYARYTANFTPPAQSLPNQ